MFGTIAYLLGSSIRQGIPLLFGATGEILTEKGGHLNLGIPGIMYVGGISGIIGGYLYEHFCANPNPALCILIPLLATIIGSGLMALIFKKTLFKGEAVPFVMELPNYRLPGAKNVIMLLWDKCKDFLQRAFTIIFLATIVVWFLRNFDFHMNMVEDSQNSILAVISGLIAPIFAPIGLNDWRIVTSLFTGFIAKESVVSTLGVLYGTSLTTLMTPLTAASLLTFSLLYTPCVAAIASVKRELGRKWALGVVLWQCVVAWAVAMVVYYICMACGLR